MTLEIFTSPALDGVTHGFFTRKGGASSGVFEGLNCGAGSSDQAEAVKLNRNRVAEAMAVPPDHLVTVFQVHSPDVMVINGTPPDVKTKADAMVTDQPGIALGILTADCQPVLFADTSNGIVGAAHAGWQGALGGILEATLDAIEEVGGDRAQTTAVIGPSISQRAYEVGPEFFDRFVDEDNDNDRFFSGGNGDRVHFDLTSYGLHRLRNAGVGHAEWTGHCTYSDPARFFSYRRSVHSLEADYGRLISTIRL